LEDRRLLAVLFTDSFELGQWDGNWAEDSQNDWFTSSQRSTPMDITHYKATWVSGADRYPDPIRPRLMANGTLCVSSKPGMSAESRRPIVIQATFDRATPLRMRVNVVSSKATLVAKADGTVFWQKTFVSGPGTGPWKQVNYVKQWDTYQNV
jgi:hypothetical protein